MKVLKKLGIQFEQVIIDLPDAVLITDKESNIVFSNPAAQQLFEYSKSELMKNKLDLLLPNSLLKRHRSHIKRFAEKKSSAGQMGKTLRISGITRSGREFPAEEILIHLGESGDKQLAMVILRDISDRFPTSDIIQHYLLGRISPNEILNVFDHLEDSIVVLDASWNYKYVNLAAQKRLDKTLNEIAGKNVWKLFPYLLGTPFEKAARKSMRDKRERVIEDYYPNSGYWYQSRLIPTDSVLLLQITDITEYKKAIESNKTLMGALDQALDNQWDRKDYRDSSSPAHE